MLGAIDDCLFATHAFATDAFCVMALSPEAAVLLPTASAMSITANAHAHLAHGFILRDFRLAQQAGAAPIADIIS